MTWLERVKAFFLGGDTCAATEASWRGPFYGLGELGTAFPIEPLAEGWQRGLTVDYQGARSVAIVYACVMLYCRAISQCLPKHLKRGADGGDVLQATSPAAAVLRYPNSYETWTQFVFQVVACLLFDGEALALKVRDARGQVVELHRIPRRNWSIHVEPESRAIFYGVNESELYQAPAMLAPARDVVHFRQHCPRHPLIGESPIKAAALAAGVTVALSKSQLAFFTQLSRPSGILSTEQTLTKDQMAQLRAAFAEQSKAWQQGGTPILSNGLKWQGVNVTQADSQLIEQQRLSGVDVARVFGVPMALLAESAGAQAGTEALISSWLSVGLGSVIENIERSLDRAFDLGPAEFVQLDPGPLLRVDFAGRIEGYVKAVQGGVMTPNEARGNEGLPRVEGGDSAYLQRQMTAIDVLGKLAAAELANASAPQPTEPVLLEADPVPEADPEKAKAVVINLFHHKRARAANEY